MGYNFSVGKKVELDITPMIGGVFGRTTGIAPGCEASLTYKKVELSVTNEYVFDTRVSPGIFTTRGRNLPTRRWVGFK